LGCSAIGWVDEITSYCTNNTIKNNCITRARKNKYDSCGVYELKCLTCEQVYVGQNGRDFKTRFDEHINDIRSNKDKSRNALHILQ
jgi:hypothetical protein